MPVCKHCKSDVTFIQKERWYVLNPDGTEHWKLCFELQKWNKKLTDKPKKDMKIGRTIAGKNYKPDGCTCGLPPWELCKPDCEYRLVNQGETNES
jgi:hypothetical protein